MSGVLTAYPGTNAVTGKNSNALTTQLTTLTHTAPSSADYAIQAMTNSAPYGFETANEAGTFVQVVRNLQVRMAELETILDTFEILA